MSSTNLQIHDTGVACLLVIAYKHERIIVNNCIVRPNFYGALLKLQGIRHERYSWAEIGRRLGVTRQAAYNLFMSESTDDSFIKYGTLGALLDFFSDEGMPITPNDLFTVETSQTNDHGLERRSS